jgi:hypothetical protein
MLRDASLSVRRLLYPVHYTRPDFSHTGEIDDLRANHFEGEGDRTGTRGVKVDAYKQERDMDKFLDEQGITNAEQDVEIGRASG